MLDLKAKLAAAGIVSAKQVEEFDQKQAKAKDAKQAKAKRKNQSHHAKPNPKSGKPNKSKGYQGKNPRPQGGGRKSKSASDPETLKTLNRGEAYVRIRKIVEHSRLDDRERTIPGADDQTFNFVTAQGSIGRLYVTAETAKSLSEGKSGISAFMGHHGLSHCVLPREIALELAQVFPLWLRHLLGHPAAGQVEVPEAESTEETPPSSSVPSDHD